MFEDENTDGLKFLINFAVELFSILYICVPIPELCGCFLLTFHMFQASLRKVILMLRRNWSKIQQRLLDSKMTNQLFY